MLLIITLASCVPRSTIIPTATIFASPTKQRTSTITPTLKPSETITAIVTETPFPPAEPFTMISKDSPNGEYVAYAYFYYGTEQQTIEIKDKIGELIWQVPYQGELPIGYDPRPTISIYRWSNDSSQLYFCYSWAPDGGNHFIPGGCSDLQTIDIRTGQIQPVLMDYANFAISPDDAQIVYLSCESQPCVIHIKNLSTGLEKTAYILSGSKNYVAIGNLEWSPIGNGIVFTTEDNTYIRQTIYLNISTMKQRVVKEYPAPEFPGWAEYEGWIDDNTLEFLQLANTGIQVIHVKITNSETIVIGTPTPRY